MKPRTHLFLATCSLLAILGSEGCGGNPPPASVADPNLAKTTLTQALDAWKKGESVDALSKKSPVVYASDDDWQSGAKLESYAIKPNDQMTGTSLRFPVTLNLKDVKGKAVTRNVVYVVVTTPVLRVDRQD